MLLVLLVLLVLLLLVFRCTLLKAVGRFLSFVVVLKKLRAPLHQVFGGFGGEGLQVTNGAVHKDQLRTNTFYFWYCKKIIYRSFSLINIVLDREESTKNEQAGGGEGREGLTEVRGGRRGIGSDP